MQSRPSTSRHTSPFECPGCRKETPIGAGPAVCVHCGASLLVNSDVSTILTPDRGRIDETLSAYLAAPMPEEVLKKAANRANLFGKYVFLRELGRGATGTVIMAWDTYLSRHVALKFLHASASANIELNDTQRVQAFLREARLAARLQHPNIVQIHEVDCRDGRYFISMDYIDGGTLAEQIHGPAGTRVRTKFYVEPGRLLGLLRTISLAVHHAHFQHPPVVHRDLKPQNVLIDGKDTPFVADFGLANEIRVDSREGSDGIRGTPAYMAPEQALGHSDQIDARTDVYSLGVILYEMLTGETPFRGENIPSVLRKIASEPPEPPAAVVRRLLLNSREVAACPEPMRRALDEICLKCLSKNREDRYASALDLAEALKPWTPAAQTGTGSSSTMAPIPPPHRRTRTVLLAAAALALPFLFLIFPLRPTPPAAAQGPVPGDELALRAAGLHAAGNWSGFRGAVAELRRTAPAQRRLKEFETLLSGRDAAVARRRTEWTSLLEGISDGSRFAEPDDVQQRIREFPEFAEEYRSGFRRALSRLETSLQTELRELSSTGPRPAWTTPELKSRAAATREKLLHLIRYTRDPESGLDLPSSASSLPLLERIIAYRGTWTLRINVAPYAELRLLDGTRELTRDYTPSLIRELEIGAGKSLELCWPSLGEAKSRWTWTIPSLDPGSTVVITGDLARPVTQVERP